jgi:hypothetical protein
MILKTCGKEISKIEIASNPIKMSNIPKKKHKRKSP